MLKTIFLVIAIALCFNSMALAAADPFEQELKALKEKLTKQLVVEKTKKKVAALDFVDLEGRRNKLGRYLAEQLTVELVGTEGISVLDRTHLKSVLDEHKLTEEGLIKPENAKKLGQFSGVDAVIIGSISVTETDVVLIVKAISTETAEVIAAGRARFPKSSEFQQLLQTAIVDGQSAVTTPSIYKDAAKDRLRIALTNVTPLRGKTPEGKDLIIGVVCSFDLTNRDLKQTLKVAHNSEAIVNEPLFIHRSKLTDSAGHVWRLAETAGLPLVSCGVKGDPGSIIQLIKTGEFTTQQALRQYTNRGFENTTGWGGDFLVIPPGATKRISLTFKDIADDGRATRHGTNTFEKFQLDTELVIGAFEEGRKDVDYCLEGIVLDRIPLPQGEK